MASRRRGSTTKARREHSPGGTRLKPAETTEIPGALAHSQPVPAEFEGALQHLTAHFFSHAVTGDADQERAHMYRLFVALGRELGRVDGTLRLRGVVREDTLTWMRHAVIEGKRATLANHDAACDCEGSKVLQAELEST